MKLRTRPMLRPAGAQIDRGRAAGWRRCDWSIDSECCRPVPKLVPPTTPLRVALAAEHALPLEAELGRRCRRSPRRSCVSM